jgi:hypothetical protein
MEKRQSGEDLCRKCSSEQGNVQEVYKLGKLNYLFVIASASTVYQGKTFISKDPYAHPQLDAIQHMHMKTLTDHKHTVEMYTNTHTSIVKIIISKK